MLKDEIKDAIREILNTDLGNIQDAISHAEDEVDNIFAKIENSVDACRENLVYSLKNDTGDIQDVIDDLDSLYQEL